MLALSSHFAGGLVLYVRHCVASQTDTWQIQRLPKLSKCMKDATEWDLRLYGAVEAGGESL